MNKKYLGLGICGITVSTLLCTIFMFSGNDIASSSYALGMVSGVFLISGLNLIFESKKKTGMIK